MIGKYLCLTLKYPFAHYSILCQLIVQQHEHLYMGLIFRALICNVKPGFSHINSNGPVRLDTMNNRQPIFSCIIHVFYMCTVIVYNFVMVCLIFIGPHHYKYFSLCDYTCMSFVN